MPLTLRVGVVIAFTFSCVQPQLEEAIGARRTAGFQPAPAGSGFSISGHTDLAAAGSYWVGQGARRSQLGKKLSWVWGLDTAPATGSTARASLLAALV